MTQRSAREARIHLISQGVVASYIHDISARAPAGAPADVAGDQRFPRSSTRLNENGNGRSAVSSSQYRPRGNR
jgi:hypothetical protein